MPPPLRRALDALLWAGLAAITAPVAFALSIALVALARGYAQGAVGGGLYMLIIAVFVSVTIALAPYAVLLVAWSALAARVRALETRRGVVVATSALALPAALVVVARSGGGAVLADAVLGAWIWLVAWVALLVPRLVIPRLRPGAFAEPARNAA